MTRMKFHERATITACLLAGFLLLLAKTISCAAEPAPEPRSESILVVGPISLADLFEKMEDKEKFGNAISKGGGPDREQMMKAFSECHFYIIDKQVRDKEDAGKLTFVKYDEGYPKLVVEGKLSFSFPQKEKPEFKINLAKAILQGPGTQRGKVENRSSIILVNLDTSPYGDDKGKSTRFDLLASRTWWDSTGKIMDSDPIPKK